MDWWMLALGIAVVVATTYDLLATSISTSSRSGFLTEFVTRTAWMFLNRVARHDDSNVLRIAGPLTVSLTIFAWLGLLWVGWTFIFASDPGAVVGSISERPVDFVGRILFTAYTVFSLGYGNYVPTGPWEIASGIALLNGLSAATMAITYVIPVVTAVTDRRRQASFITSAGTSAEEIVETLFDGDGHSVLENLVIQVAPQILLTGQRHLSYPVIHHYHGAERRSAFPPAVAALDDAITLLEIAAPPGQRPKPPIVAVWRRAVDQLLDLVEFGSDESIPVPPPPSLGVLERLGWEPMNEDAYHEAVREHEARRQRMHQYVRYARWTWPTETSE